MPMPYLFDPTVERPLQPTHRPERTRKGTALLVLGSIVLAGLGLSFSARAAAEFTVQIGAFEKRPSATFAEAASRHGEMLIATGDDGITRVSIGRHPDRATALSAVQQLRSVGYPDAFVAPLLGQGSIRSLRPAATSSAAPATSSAAPAPATKPPAPTTPAPQPAPAPSAPPSAPTAATAGSTAAPVGRAAQPIGRFRLRTHDTQSGQTKDLVIGGPATGPTIRQTPPPIVGGRSAGDVPIHLRDKLVYLDGAPYIKDGDRFIPLSEALAQE